MAQKSRAIPLPTDLTKEQVERSYRAITAVTEGAVRAIPEGAQAHDALAATMMMLSIQRLHLTGTNDLAFIEQATTALRNFIQISPEPVRSTGFAILEAIDRGILEQVEAWPK